MSSALTSAFIIGEHKANMPVSAALLREQIQTALGDRCDAAFDLKKSAYQALPSAVGEIPRGTLTEIAGPMSSGRTSLLHSLMAEVCARQEFCALIDAGDRFDPASAAAAGVRLSQVLWVRCGGIAAPWKIRGPRCSCWRGKAIRNRARRSGWRWRLRVRHGVAGCRAAFWMVSKRRRSAFANIAGSGSGSALRGDGCLRVCMPGNASLLLECAAYFSPLIE